MTPDTHRAAVFAGLPGMTPHRLRQLVEVIGIGESWRLLSEDPTSLGERLAPVPAVSLVATWSDQVRGSRGEGSLARMAEACHTTGVRVVLRGDDEYPSTLRDDPHGPAVLFVSGVGIPAGVRLVGIVGTRNATAAGRAMAHELGCGLASAGVAVVSGLARGIDAAAHRGVIAADGPGLAVGVVACGHDVPYPRENAALWRAIGAEGTLISESAPGTAPEPHRFPLRNRIIAGLSEVLVVVESRTRGGSLITAVEAAARGVPVMAVPGGVRSAAAAGVNDLLADGAAPVRDVDDVLVALGLHTIASSWRSAARGSSPLGNDELDDVEAAILATLAEGPATLDTLTVRTGEALWVVARSLGRLEGRGRVATVGGWIEMVP
jgi:DNA processing protein